MGFIVNTDLLVQIADLYYLQNMSQMEIAKTFNISRPTVSRMLAEAKREGIVDIRIHNPVSVNSDMSRRLRETTRLKNAIVISGKYGYKDALKLSAEAAAKFLFSVLEDGDTLSIAWGDAINMFCDSMECKKYSSVTVAQMAGSLGSGNPHEDVMELALRISEKLGCRYSNVNSPLFIDNDLVYEHMIAEPTISSAITRASRADIAITGIGTVSARSLLVETGYVDECDMTYVRSQGAVAQLLAQPFDKHGSPVPWTNKHVVAAPLSTLRNARWSIGICAGAYKSEAALACINAGYINVLITDETLALSIIMRTEQSCKP